jgi:hypothetical protein
MAAFAFHALTFFLFENDHFVSALIFENLCGDRSSDQSGRTNSEICTLTGRENFVNLNSGTSFRIGVAVNDKNVALGDSELLPLGFDRGFHKIKPRIKRFQMGERKDNLSRIPALATRSARRLGPQSAHPILSLLFEVDLMLQREFTCGVPIYLLILLRFDCAQLVESRLLGRFDGGNFTMSLFFRLLDFGQSSIFLRPEKVDLVVQANGLGFRRLALLLRDGFQFVNPRDSPFGFRGGLLGLERGESPRFGFGRGALTRLDLALFDGMAASLHILICVLPIGAIIFYHHPHDHGQQENNGKFLHSIPWLRHRPVTMVQASISITKETSEQIV